MLTVSQLLKKLPAFYATKGSLPNSQQSTIGQYMLQHTPFNIQFNIIPYQHLSLPSGFQTKNVYKYH
jgi:hypothetical protein